MSSTGLTVGEFTLLRVLSGGSMQDVLTLIAAGGGGGGGGRQSRNASMSSIASDDSKNSFRSLAKLSQQFLQVFLVGYDVLSLPQASEMIQGTL